MTNETVAPAKLDVAPPAQGTVAETAYDNWDAELTPLVRENADVIVRCPWQDDAEMTLSAAINSIQISISKENVEQVVAEVYLMLANRVTEITEEPDDAEGETEETTKKESAQPKDSTVKMKTEKPKKQPTSEMANDPPALDRQMPTEVPKREITKQADVETISKDELYEEIVAEITQTTEEVAATTTIVDLEPANNIAPTKTAVEFSTDTSIDVMQKDEARDSTDVDDGKVYHYDTAETDTYEEITLDEAVEIPADKPIDVVEPQIVNEPKKDKLVTVSEDEDDYQKNIDTAEQTKPNQETFEIYEKPIKEPDDIENTLSLIKLKLEFIEPEVLTEVNEIIDKVIDFTETIELEGLDQEQAQQNLEEMFVELFEILEINYTSEQIEALTESVLSKSFGLNDTLSTKVHNDSIVKHIASLRHLIISLSSAYAVGRSVLKMCKIKKLQVAL